MTAYLESKTNKIEYDPAELIGTGKDATPDPVWLIQGSGRLRGAQDTFASESPIFQGSTTLAVYLNRLENLQHRSGFSG